MLEVKNLRAGYGAINVLWDISLEIQPGKLTAIIGPNGAGKTTLLKLILGEIQPDVTTPPGKIRQGADRKSVV